MGPISSYGFDGFGGEGNEAFSNVSSRNGLLWGLFFLSTHQQWTKSNSP
jgi:hypothetical protein